MTGSTNQDYSLVDGRDYNLGDFAHRPLCDRTLGGCTVRHRRFSKEQGRLVTCYSLHCCAPDHEHRWVYWEKGMAYALETRERLKEGGIP